MAKRGKRRNDTLGAQKRRLAAQSKPYAGATVPYKWCTTLETPLTERLRNDMFDPDYSQMAVAGTVTGRITNQEPPLHELHPSRYPRHRGDKGQRWGGECNITACSRQDAVMYNVATYGYYCRECAAAINYNPRVAPLCIEVEGQLTGAQMDEFARAAMQQMRKERNNDRAS